MTALEGREIILPNKLWERIEQVRQQYTKRPGNNISENDFLVLLLKIGSTKIRAELLLENKLSTTNVVLV